DSALDSSLRIAGVHRKPGVDGRQIRYQYGALGLGQSPQTLFEGGGTWRLRLQWAGQRDAILLLAGYCNSRQLRKPTRTDVGLSGDASGFDAKTLRSEQHGCAG